MSLRLVLLAIVTFLVTPALASPAAGERAPEVSQSLYEPLNIERVVDGDTFYASGKKIRLWGIDAPEKEDPMYEISTKALELFVDGSELKCKLIEMDRYERFVMHCFINQTDLGGLMVQTGFAKDYPKYSGRFYQREQEFAQKGKLGVWE